MKKKHIGSHNTPKCTRGVSMHMVGRRKPSITVDIETFKALPKDVQCKRCATLIDTTDFARGLGNVIFGDGGGTTA